MHVRKLHRRQCPCLCGDINHRSLFRFLHVLSWSTCCLLCTVFSSTFWLHWKSCKFEELALWEGNLDQWEKKGVRYINSFCFLSLPHGLFKTHFLFLQNLQFWMDFPGDSAVKNLPANAGDVGNAGSILWLGRSPGGGHSNPLQYSSLGNPLNRGAWQALVCGVAKNWTQPHEQTTTAMFLSARWDKHRATHHVSLWLLLKQKLCNTS